jgi:soluble lytic murein transglycosylase
MQVLPQTAAHSSRASRIRTASRRLYDPNYNVRVGCAYLAKLLKDFDGKPELAVAAYNAGDFRVNDWEKKYSFRDSEMFLESIPIPATRTYVELVLRDAEIYRQLLTRSPHFAKCSPTLPTVPPGARGATLQGGTSAAQRAGSGRGN